MRYSKVLATQPGYDVADYLFDEEKRLRRCRRFDDGSEPSMTSIPNGMSLIRTIDLNPLAEEWKAQYEVEAATESDPSSSFAGSTNRRRFWRWYALPQDSENGTRASVRPIRWDHHTHDVAKRASWIVKALGLPDDLKQAVVLAAELHDLGKKREVWQRSIGNPNPTDWHAKSGKPAYPPRWRPGFRIQYRHEFGSLLDILDPHQEYSARIDALSDEMRDVVLHLIAAHHGRARPHFPPEETGDPNHAQAGADELAIEIMRRYARLQRRYGRWGLAYLESLLRAADWAASAEPTVTEVGEEAPL